MEKDSAPHQQELDQQVDHQHGESLEQDVRWRIQRLLEVIYQLLLVVEGLSWIGLSLMNVSTGSSRRWNITNNLDNLGR